MDVLNNVVAWMNGKLWDFLLIIILCGTGLFFTLRLKFIQIRKLPASFHEVFKDFKWKGTSAGKDGMSSFQSLATAIAGQVGTGNLAGVATAMVSGGPGAVFWMWVSAFFGMAMIYAEAILGQKYKQTVDGEVVGGPVYYIQAAIKGKLGKILAAVFAILLILALGFIGNMTQANSIGKAMNYAFGIPPLVTGLIVALLAFIVFQGGIKRIASLTEKLVPIMAIFFILVALVIIGIHYKNILPSFYAIFVGAFKPNAVMGGILGVTMKQAVRFGIARGLFTHEAGMGSTPHAHALAKVDHPAQQGMVAMVGVVIDTFIVIPMTVLIILTTGVLGTVTSSGEFLTGIELTQFAFSTSLGQVGKYLIAIAVFFFAFSTIIGWYFFGHSNVKYLFGKKALPVYTIIVCVFIVLGCLSEVGLVWALADLFNGLMVLPNLLGMILLSGVVVSASKDYDQKIKNQSLLRK